MARGIFGDIARATGTAPFFGVKTTAEIAGNKQQAALQQARQPLEQGYQRLSELYQPYADIAAQQMGGLGTMAEQIGAQEYGVPQYQAPREFSYSSQEFMQSPYYQMQKQAGEEAINRQMAARGLFASTPALQNIAKYNQDLAASGYQQARQNAFQESQANRSAYENYINMLRQMGQERYGREADRFTRGMQQVQLGQPFTQALGTAATQRGGDLASLLTQRGNVQAATEVQRANDLRNLLQQAVGAGAAYYTGGMKGLAGAYAPAGAQNTGNQALGQLLQTLINQGGAQ